MTTTNEAWADEIRIMQEVLLPWKDEDGQVIFEYDIPRLGKRIDVVLLLRGLIFCLEFKTRQEAKKENMQSYIEQVLDYALDLKNFHLLSQNRIIVPILIHPWISKSSSVFQASVYDDSIYNTKMNWNSFNLYTKLPATIDTSNTLAQVGNLLHQYNGATYDYRYFI